jgi:hypothetical protein
MKTLVHWLSGNVGICRNGSMSALLEFEELERTHLNCCALEVNSVHPHSVKARVRLSKQTALDTIMLIQILSRSRLLHTTQQTI